MNEEEKEKIIEQDKERMNTLAEEAQKEIRKEEKKKSCLPKVLYILLVLILLGTCLYFINDKYEFVNLDGKKKEPKTEKKEKKKVEPKKEEKQEQDIYEQINNIKNENLNEIEKIEKLSNTVMAYIHGEENIRQKSKCEIVTDKDLLKENNYYYCKTIIYFPKDDEESSWDYYFDKTVTYMNNSNYITSLDKNITETDDIKYASLESEKFLYMDYKYYDILNKKINDTYKYDIYKYLEKKYNVDSEFICPGYSYKIGDKYFYLNFSTAEKGAYSLNRSTGECNDITKELVTYKFDITTNKYETIEK